MTWLGVAQAGIMPAQNRSVWPLAHSMQKTDHTLVMLVTRAAVTSLACQLSGHDGDFGPWPGSMSSWTPIC